MSVMHTVIENDNIQVTNSLCVVIDNIQEKEVHKQTMILKTYAFTINQFELQLPWNQ